MDKKALISKIKNKIEEIQDSTMDSNRNFPSSYEEGKFDGLSLLEAFIDSLETDDGETHIERELSEVYIAYFDKKFPGLPKLKGQKLHDFKNFLNTCQQIFGLKWYDLHPVQSRLFERLTLLWAVWGKEHL